jgi:gas vesicle protein
MDQTTAPPTGQSTGEQMQDKAKEAAGQAQEKVQETAQQAKGQLRTQVDQRSSQAGEKVTGTASDIRTIAQQLREQGNDQPAKLAEQAADRAERLGGYLSNSNADRILGDVEGYARRQPWAVAVGGALVGFAASRFLKASSRERYAQGTTGSTGMPARPVPHGGNGSGTFAPAPAPVAQAPVAPAPQPTFDRLVPTDQVVPGADRPTPPVVQTDEVIPGSDRGGFS